MYHLSLAPKSEFEMDLASLMMEVIPRAMREIRSENRSHRGKDLTLPQFRVLANVWRRAKTNKELAEDIGLSFPAMSRIVQGLSRRGLVDRLENPADRREHFIQITKEGLVLYKSIRQKTCQKMDLRLNALSFEEKKVLSRGLALISKAILATD